MSKLDIKESYEHLISLLEEGILKENPFLSFSDFSQMCGCSEEELNEYVYSELGYNGIELIRKYVLNAITS